MECRSPLFRIAALIGLLFWFSGCGQRQSDLDLLIRGPVSLQHIDPTNVDQYATDQTAVFKAIAIDAGLTVSEPPSSTQWTSDQWKQFITAAFGYADGQCEDYIEALRRLDIRRRQTTQQLNLVGAATAGILGVTQAASAAIAITGVAFGLASATVDNVAGGLLYELPPSEIGDLVGRLKVAYTNALTPDNWQSRAASFRTIRGYVQYCLPATIEANVKKAIAVAAPQGLASKNSALGAPPSVDIAAQQFVIKASDPVPGNVGPRPELPNRLSSFERTLAPGRIKALQAALCTTEDGDPGPLNSKTRGQIGAYLIGRGRLDPATATDVVIDSNNWGALREVLDDRRTCAARGFVNGYEVGRYGFPVDRTALVIAKFQNGLKALLLAAGSNVDVPTNGSMSADPNDGTRKAIRAYRDLKQLRPEWGDQVDPELGRLALQAVP